MPLLIAEVVTPPSTNVISRPSPVITTIPSSAPSQDVKKDVTPPPASLSHARVLNSMSVSGGKKSDLDSSKDTKLSSDGSSTSAMNGAANHIPKPPDVENNTTKEAQTHPHPRQPNSAIVKNVSQPIVRPHKSLSATSETSMRGKPPLPIHRVDVFTNYNPKPPPVVFNGKMPPLRLALTTPTNNGKRKVKIDGESTKPSSPRKKVTKLTPTEPAILAALQKIAGFVPSASAPPIHSAPAVTKSNILLSPPPAVTAAAPMDTISIDTAGKNFHSPASSAQPSLTTSDDAISPLSSPTAAYKPTAAQSACTQPAKLRFKKSLNSVVQELATKAPMEACSPTKKMKFENGSGEEHGATLIH